MTWGQLWAEPPLPYSRVQTSFHKRNSNCKGVPFSHGEGRGTLQHWGLDNACQWTRLQLESAGLISLPTYLPQPAGPGAPSTSFSRAVAQSVLCAPGFTPSVVSTAFQSYMKNTIFLMWIFFSAWFLVSGCWIKTKQNKKDRIKEKDLLQIKQNKNLPLLQSHVLTF